MNSMATEDIKNGVGGSLDLGLVQSPSFCPPPLIFVVHGFQESALIFSCIKYKSLDFSRPSDRSSQSSTTSRQNGYLS
jgi:hypothetical protein